MKNSVKSVGIIGGADGPTSVFVAGGRKKRTLKQKIREAIYKKKRDRTEKKIVANPHTLAEVVQYLQEKYSAVEVSEQFGDYKEQYNCIKESLIYRYKPELLGELAEIKKPAEYTEETIKELQQQIALRRQKAESIVEDAFPLDYHIYEVQVPNAGTIQFEIEMIWEVFGGSYSGSKKGMKRLKAVYTDVCLYYGVSKKDIETRSERYMRLLAALSA